MWNEEGNEFINNFMVVICVTSTCTFQMFSKHFSYENDAIVWCLSSYVRNIKCEGLKDFFQFGSNDDWVLSWDDLTLEIMLVHT